MIEKRLQRLSGLEVEIGVQGHRKRLPSLKANLQYRILEENVFCYESCS